MPRRLAPRLFIGLVTALLIPAVATAATGDVPIRIPDQAVYDLAGTFDQGTEQSAENLARTVRSIADADIVVVSESVDEGFSAADAATRATTLRLAMGVGDNLDGGGLVVYFGIEPSGCGGQIALNGTADFAAGALPPAVATAIVETDIGPLVTTCDLDSALLVGMSRIATAVLTADTGTGTAGGGGGTGTGSGQPAVAAGPPFPDNAEGVGVYDHAGLLRPDTIASAEKTIDAIATRTGAQVVVYTQVVEDGRTTEQADQDARALMDQWGVGRKGFDDGLVILFDMYPGLVHGQVILYGGPGFIATFLDNAQKQAIFENDMLPRIKAGDFDGAVLVAIQRVDDAATPEHARALDQARQVNAVIGLVVAPLLAVLLVGSAAWSWLRFGRDPVYLDDPSIHMAGPPEALTPAGAVFVLAGGSSRRALTTALLDLASRGELAFRQESHLLGLKKQVGIETRPADPDPGTRARQLRNAARALGPAERLVRDKLASLGGGADGYIEPDELLKFGASVPDFNKALEEEAVARGWFRETPSKAVARWMVRAAIAGVVGVVAILAGVNVPSSGVLLIGIGLVVGAIIVGVMAQSMPAVSLPGAMIRAMLAAYRRTLKKTMDQARSMDQVVAEAGLPWLETPDQAVVWSTALGLHAEIETVLGRALDDQRDGRVAPGAVWLPTWYGTSAGGAAGFAGDFAGAGSGSGGIFSSSAIPDFGGMMSALG
ncbi:MAG TPA: TPM domain-containing protein, partial [Candidatus Limnocylindrales bacterium]|nr:TPM domain-containing protein [Candidatus Limnocylindrales bacterium]